MSSEAEIHSPLAHADQQPQLVEGFQSGIDQEGGGEDGEEFGIDAQDQQRHRNPTLANEI